jgi:hypothetical protein
MGPIERTRVWGVGASGEFEEGAIMTKPISQLVFEELSELKNTLALHVAMDTANVEKVTAMYGIIVTGQDGQPSLPETVRQHDAWIKDRKSGVEEETRSSVAFRRQIILLFVGQALTLLILGIAAYIGWR